MKKLLIILAMAMVLFAATAFAGPFLVCDPITDAIMFQIEVDGIEVATDYPAEPDGSLHYDMAAHTGGDHTVRARARNLWMYGGWSVPLDFNADGPGAPSGFGFSAE